MEQYEQFPIVGINVVLNNAIIYLILASQIIPVQSRLNKEEIIPTNWGIVNETLYRSVLTMVHNYVGVRVSVYFPLIYTVFHQILFSNQIGMIPYSYTPTVQLILTQAQGVTLQFGILIQGFIRHKWQLFGFFTPAGIPMALVPQMVFIEILSYLTRTLSLGLRLSVNMITGHTLVKVFSGFIWQGFISGTSFLVLLLPQVILTVFQALEILIAYLQAYIFTVITCITLKDLANTCF